MFVVKEGCPGCGACVSACPVKVIKLEKRKAVIQQDKCIKCGICVPYCPVKLIHEQERSTSQSEKKNLKKQAFAAKEVENNAK